VVTGTGSIVASFHQGAADAWSKAIARACGWGWILGDKGGGFNVGCTAVCALLTQQDMKGLAIAHGPLREKLLKKFGVSTSSPCK